MFDCDSDKQVLPLGIKIFIKEIKIAYVLSCLTDPDKIRFTAFFEKDISEILPYLNAVIKGGIYHHNGRTLTIRKKGCLITLHPDKITAGRIVDEKDAKEIIEWLKELINYCYENRDKIEPSFDRREKITPLDIYRLIPATNCKKCGELTCLAFAVKLSNEETKIIKCSKIFSGKYTKKRNELFKILKSAGYEVPSTLVDER